MEDKRGRGTRKENKKNEEEEGEEDTGRKE
jgi:hypothetical protein